MPAFMDILNAPTPAQRRRESQAKFEKERISREKDLLSIDDSLAKREERIRKQKMMAGWDMLVSTDMAFEGLMKIPETDQEGAQRYIESLPTGVRETMLPYLEGKSYDAFLADKDRIEEEMVRRGVLKEPREKSTARLVRPGTPDDKHYGLNLRPGQTARIKVDSDGKLIDVSTFGTELPNTPTQKTYEEGDETITERYDGEGNLISAHRAPRWQPVAPAALSETEKKINRIQETYKLDPQTATAIAMGDMDLNYDPVARMANPKPKDTYYRKVQAAEKRLREMGYPDPEGAAVDFGLERIDVKMSESGMIIQTDNFTGEITRIQPKVPSRPERDLVDGKVPLFDMANNMTGTISAAKQAVNVAGGVFNMESVFPEVERARQSLRDENQRLVQAFVLSRRYPSGQIDAVEERISQLPELLTSPGAYEQKATQLDVDLRQKLADAEEGAEDITLPQDAKDDYAVLAKSIRDYLRVLAVPKPLPTTTEGIHAMTQSDFDRTMSYLGRNRDGLVRWMRSVSPDVIDAAEERRNRR